MSVAIATMGMFTPITSGGVGEIIRYVEVDRGSSDGWWLRAKPQVVIRSVMEDDKYDRNKKPIVKILEVTNGNGKVVK